jgi:hypothetical protein
MMITAPIRAALIHVAAIAPGTRHSKEGTGTHPLAN